jgi:hypothetical protein
MRVSGLVISQSIPGAHEAASAMFVRAAVAKMPIVVVGLEISPIAHCIRWGWK